MLKDSRAEKRKKKKMRAEKRKLEDPKSPPLTPPSVENSDDARRTLLPVVESCEHSSDLAAGVDPSSSIPRVAGIFLNKLSSIDSWLLQEEEYMKQFICAPSELDLDFFHQLLQLSVLFKVRL